VCVFHSFDSFEIFLGANELIFRNSHLNVIGVLYRGVQWLQNSGVFLERKFTILLFIGQKC